MGRRTRMPAANASRPSFSGTSSSDWSPPALSDFDVGGEDWSGNWDDLNREDRAKVADAHLHGTADAERFEDLKFPVVEPSTGNLNENALRAVIGGRGAQVEGISADERARARRMAYRLLNEEFDADLEVPSLEDLQAKDHGEPTIHAEHPGSEGLLAVSRSIQQRLDGMDGEGKLHFLEEVFENEFVYRVEHTETGEDQLFRRSYQIQEDGDVTFGDDAVRVRRQVTYEPVSEGEPETQEDESMTTVNQLIANERTQLTEDDRGWLENLTEGQLARLEPAEPVTNGQQPSVNREQAMEVLRESIQDKETFLSLLPADLREQVQHGLQLHQGRRQELTGRITANCDAWSDEELQAKPIDELEKLAQAVQPTTSQPSANYAPLGGGQPPAMNGADEGPAPLLPTGVEPPSQQQ